MKKLALLLGVLMALSFAGVAEAHWPVANQSSYISGTFTEGRGTLGRHNGVDIAAPYGTAVLPMDTGTVVYAGWWRYGYGGNVVITRRPGTNVYVMYAHMSAVSVRVGQRIWSYGTRIGRVGTSGCASRCGAHLHVSVWRGFPLFRGSVAVNPWPGYLRHGPYLPRRYR